jgi:hypothetical protein
MGKGVKREVFLKYQISGKGKMTMNNRRHKKSEMRSKTR